ncbi:RNA polymerase sigma factor [Robertmurraya andreesenii]|uniref:RNA polymerase sigma-70 factor (ECF subfamily) n=1 Tax=Anoxybacillus andreesenii TaxID=1325932 RepID=A0ABT9UZ75_9BACL|nr:RNA polymerase sigma factor [Robertmurraya andreesenii]MDQ0153945.1 RNA polymerase sigma-70 factor (ECF subfamily) [Robertmurraya andreesenii]
MKEYEIERIIADYEIGLRYLAFRYVRDWILVDDIMQDVYLKVFLKLDTFQGKSNIKSWLYRITANQCIDYLRSREMKSTVLIDNLEEVDSHSGVSVENDIIERLEKEVLYQNIRSLPDDYKQTLSLYYLNDYSYREISEALCKDITYVKNRLFRGRRLLKKVYQENELKVV